MGVTEKDSDLSFGGVETVNHVGERIALLPALCHHMLHGLPRIPSLLHHPDDFQYGLNLLHVSLY